jgi:hypothetical protein
MTAIAGFSAACLGKKFLQLCLLKSQKKRNAESEGSSDFLKIIDGSIGVRLKNRCPARGLVVTDLLLSGGFLSWCSA